VRVLLFTLYGALSAFGDVAEHGVRPVGTRPTRSGVLGLVAGCLGYIRSDLDRHRELSEGLGFAVATLNPGQSLLDYHTVQTATNPKGGGFSTRAELLAANDVSTMLSSREWRSGSFYVVALWQKGEAPIDLDAIQAALRCPVYTPYLGRKAASLSLPMNPRIVQADDVPSAILADNAEDHYVSVAFPGGNEGFKRSDYLEVACDPQMPGLPENSGKQTRRDLKTGTSMRAFSERTERVFLLSRKAA
jgi:CRISPR system Cascade subunit CasD